MKLKLIKWIKKEKYPRQSKKELINCKDAKKKKIGKEFVKSRIKQLNFLKDKKQRSRKKKPNFIKLNL